jgi:multidrug transporter EmrE-like cation transporter
MGLLYVIGTVFFTVYGQLVLKWRVGLHGDLPRPFVEKVVFLFSLFGDLWVVSGFAAAFTASLFWMAAISKLELSFAYPFMSSAFVLVLFLSVFLFNEALTWQKITGVLLIVTGLVVSSQG